MTILFDSPFWPPHPEAPGNPNVSFLGAHSSSPFVCGVTHSFSRYCQWNGDGRVEIRARDLGSDERGLEISGSIGGRFGAGYWLSLDSSFLINKLKTTMPAFRGLLWRLREMVRVQYPSKEPIVVAITITVITGITVISVHWSLLCAGRNPKDRSPLSALVIPIGANVPIAPFSRSSNRPCFLGGPRGRGLPLSAWLLLLYFSEHSLRSWLALPPATRAPHSPVRRACASARGLSLNGKRKPPCAGKRVFQTTGSRWEKCFLDVFPEP